MIKLDNGENKITDSENLEHIISGVISLGKDVKVLNERVYSKNYLDRVRNFLIIGFIITFLIVSGILGSLLYNQKIENEKRAKEAVLGRRQLADCTVKPGVVLDGDYVNPGVCYLEGAERTGAAIKTLTVEIQEGVRQLLLIQAEAVAANKTLSDDVRSFARQQVQTLRDFVPKTTTSTIP